MIPNALQRKSIKAVAQYILYDKGVFKTQDRVDWTHTMNMATSDPDTAWRMMARTVKLQDYIKAENGVRVGGGKPNTQHTTLCLCGIHQKRRQRQK